MKARDAEVPILRAQLPFNLSAVARSDGKPDTLITETAVAAYRWTSSRVATTRSTCFFDPLTVPSSRFAPVFRAANDARSGPPIGH